MGHIYWAVWTQLTQMVPPSGGLYNLLGAIYWSYKISLQADLRTVQIVPDAPPPPQDHIMVGSMLIPFFTSVTPTHACALFGLWSSPQCYILLQKL